MLMPHQACLSRSDPIFDAGFTTLFKHAQAESRQALPVKMRVLAKVRLFLGSHLPCRCWMAGKVTPSPAPIRHRQASTTYTDLVEASASPGTHHRCWSLYSPQRTHCKSRRSLPSDMLQAQAGQTIRVTQLLKMHLRRARKC